MEFRLPTFQYSDVANEFTYLNVGSSGAWTHDLLHGSPTLYEMIQQGVVAS